MKDSEEVSLGVDDPEATLLDQLERLSVPLAAQGCGVLAGTSILKAAEPCAIAAPVLEQKNTAGLPAHAGEFSQCSDGVGKRAEAHRVDDRIEGFVGERQMLRVHDFEIADETDPVSAPSGLGQHPLAKIDPRHPNTLRIVREVLSRPDGHLQDVSVGALAELAPKPPKPEDLGSQLRPIVKPRECVVLVCDLYGFHGPSRLLAIPSLAHPSSCAFVLRSLRTDRTR